MNWTDVSTIKKYEIQTYIDNGFFDYSGRDLFPNLTIEAANDYEIYFALLVKMIYKNEDINLANMLDSVIVLCAFCKYISFDSLFEIFLFSKNKKRLHNKLKKILASPFFEKISFRNGGENIRNVYGLSRQGLERACEIIPQGSQPINFENQMRRRNRGRGYVAHDYYCGISFTQLLLFGEMLTYEREHEFVVVEMIRGVDQITKRIKADAFAYFIGGPVLYLEQDLSTELPDVLLQKIEYYYRGEFIGRTCSNVLFISVRNNVNDMIERYFPFVFNRGCVDKVCSFIDFFKCNLRTLLLYFSYDTYDEIYTGESLYMSDEILLQRNNLRNKKEGVGLITIEDFQKICDYNGKKPFETLYMTALCAKSIYLLLKIPEMRQVINACYGNSGKAEMGNEVGAIEDSTIMKFFKSVCTDAICINPFYIALKNLYNQAEYTKRKNRLLLQLMHPFYAKTDRVKLANYHIPLLYGTEVMLAPTNFIAEYALELRPKTTNYFGIMGAILKKYFWGAKFVDELSERLETEERYPNLYMRNFFKYHFSNGKEEYKGEIYFENTHLSIGALFRVKFLLEQYCSLSLADKNITVICIANNFIDAVNIALFLDYWKLVEDQEKASDELAKEQILLYKNKRKLNVCFIEKKDILNSEQVQNPLFFVQCEKKEEGYSGKDYGYASKKGIYHAGVNGRCDGFYKQQIYAPFSKGTDL